MNKRKGLMILLLALVVLAGAGYYGVRIVQGTTGSAKYEKEAINLEIGRAHV